MGSQYALRQRLRLWNQKEVAALLGISANWLQWHRDQFPPSVQIGKRWVYTMDDIARIEAALVERSERNPNRTRMERLYSEGLYTITEAARMMDRPRITLSKALAAGRIPRPTHRVGTQLFYTARDLEALRRYFNRHDKD